MTGMSRSDSANVGCSTEIPCGYSMASGLHRIRAYVKRLAPLVLLGLGACVIPLDLEVEVSDAGISSPPVLESAASPFEFPGPFTLGRDDTDVNILLTISDNDIDDTLFVRLFLDYDADQNTNLVTDCIAPPTGDRERSASCVGDTICNFIEEGDTSLHTLEAHVTDRLWLTADDPDAEGQPPLRAVAANAGDSVRSWTVRCE